MDKVRFAVITDIHYGPDAGAKYGSKSAKLLDVFTKAAAGYGLDCIVDMGDRVTAHSHDEAVKNMQDVKAQFNKVAVPTYSVIGNHDLLHMTREENEQVMGSPGTSYSRDVKGYHFVFFNPPLDLSHNGLHMTQEELDWLEKDLASTDKPTIVFSHVPLDNDEADNKSGRAASKSDRLYFFYPEGPQVREIMEKSGKVIMAMAGHRHTNRYREINGIHYITQQSLVQAYEKHYRKPHRAWSVIELDDDKITVKLKGRAPMRLQGSMTKKFTLVPRTSPKFVPKQIPDSAPEGMDAWVPPNDDMPEADVAKPAGSAPIVVPESILPKPGSEPKAIDTIPAQPEEIPAPATPKPPEPSL
ncbi:MAG TPA: metallophosphoesterase [Patescibacteria group bacterium]|nr:metallophosphoesterase [Patescibacteria group bacterium]